MEGHKNENPFQVLKPSKTEEQSQGCPNLCDKAPWVGQEAGKVLGPSCASDEMVFLP